MTMQTDLATNVETSLAGLGEWFAANQARLVTALILVVIGVLLAMLLRALTVRLMRALERAAPGRDFRTPFAGLTREGHASTIVGAVVFWAVLLLFLATAVDALASPVLSAVVDKLSAFVPRVLVAVLIFVAGLVIGNVARSAMTAAAARAGTAFAPGIGQLVRYAIILAAALMAVAELGVDIALVTAILSVGFAALLGGFAIAFGLGARTAISNIIGSHYMRQTLEVGQLLRIDGIEGTIAALTPISIILDVPEGRVIVPASRFGESPSVLLTRPGAA
jgi:hypothetical protein